MSSTQVTENSKSLRVNIKISKARLSVSVAKFGKMNPYVLITAGDQTWKSKVSESGDLKPT